MKLVHITTVPQSLYSFFEGQMGYMKAMGFEVHAITSPGKTLEEFVRREKIQVHTVEMARQITPFRDLEALMGIRALLRRIRPQIVHAHTPKGGLLGMMAAHLAGVPVKIYHIHGLPLLTARGWKRSVLRLTERVSCRLADRVFCVSASLQECVGRSGLAPAGKMLTIGHGSINGVDTAGKYNPARFDRQARQQLLRQYAIPEGSPVVGFLGRIVRDKGIVDLFAAWQEIRQRFPEAILLLVGPVEEQDPVPADILQRLQADPRVRLTGPVLDAPPLYALMDLLVLPSYREGFGLAAIEAAAMGLPVVASRIPGIVDAVEDGATGVLVPPRSPAALAGAIGTYLGQPPLRMAHGKAGRRRAERLFDQAGIWRELHAQYLDLARGHGLPQMLTQGGGHR